MNDEEDRMEVTLKAYTLVWCHEFFKRYVADPAMTYDRYVYDEDHHPTDT